MSRDDYRQRVDNYQRYQDYKYDQKIFQQGLSQRNTQVHEALRARDYDSAAWALRIPGHHASSSRAITNQDNDQAQSLASQTQALIGDIKACTYLSEAVQSHWITGLQTLPEITRKSALNRIVDFKIAFSAWKLSNRPQENMWDIGNTKIWLFDSEMLLIECKIDRIRWLLEAES